jgi:Zn-dependent M28 family amino/carboxypeptidase
MTDSAASRLAQLAGSSLAAWTVAADLGIAATVAVHTVTQGAAFTSHNVVRRIAGSDPQLRDQCVVYSTHRDGCGVGPAVGGDSIYNAAADDAGGIAEMLGIAAGMHALPHPPRRAVVFVASTVKEDGLLGAEAYAGSPVRPVSRTALAIGMDVFDAWGAATAFRNDGFGYTSVDSLLGALAARRALEYDGVRVRPRRPAVVIATL